MLSLQVLILINQFGLYEKTMEISGLSFSIMITI